MTGSSSETPRPICDYEGSRYQHDFWVGQGREYEDLAERIAISRLLPARGGRLLEIGAGFGRLADLYAGYEQVVLLDYSKSLLRQAKAAWGHDPRFTFVAADLYTLPFSEAQFDAIVMVRVIHHLVDVPAALAEVARALVGGGAFVLEYANKRNLKAMARYLLRRQSWSPFSLEPNEFVTLNFNFHPAWIAERIEDAGFACERALTLSHFRMAALKRLIPHTALARMDGWVQPTGELWKLAPSVMMRLRRAPSDGPTPGTLFRCPACGAASMVEKDGSLHCRSCQHDWPIDDGIYDFKPPER